MMISVIVITLIIVQSWCHWSLTRVTGDLIMTIIISAIITPNDTHHHPHLTLSRVLSGTTHSGTDNMSPLMMPLCLQTV